MGGWMGGWMDGWAEGRMMGVGGVQETKQAPSRLTRGRSRHSTVSLASVCLWFCFFVFYFRG